MDRATAESVVNVLEALDFDATIHEDNSVCTVLVATGYTTIATPQDVKALLTKRTRKNGTKES